MTTVIGPTALEAADAARLLQDLDAGRIELPSEIVEAVRLMIIELGRGNDVTVTATAAELTTAEAASLLNVSRPHVAHLADTGQLPHHKVGTHRRLRVNDVLDYKRRRDAQSLQALAEIHDLADESGMDL